MQTSAIARPRPIRPRSAPWRARVGIVLILGVGLTQPARAPSAAGRPPGMVGVLVSRHEAVLATEVAGRLESIRYELGQSVAAGVVVARIDDRSLREALAKARSELDAAEATASMRASERVEAEARYSRRMQIADVYSAEEVAQAKLERDRAVQSHEAAVAGAKALRANVAGLRLRVDAASIRAPFRGSIATRYQTPGTWVDVGAPILRLVDETDVWVRFAASPDLAACLQPDSGVRVLVPGIAGEIAGTIRHVGPEIDPASGLLTLEASLDTGRRVRARLHSGLPVRVRSATGCDR